MVQEKLLVDKFLRRCIALILALCVCTAPLAARQESGESGSMI